MIGAGAGVSPAASRAMVWIGRLAAIAALACFGLAIVAVQRGRIVQASAGAIVADLERSNASLAAVDLGAAQVSRRQLDELASILERLRQTARTDAGLLIALREESRRLAASTGDSLEIARRLETTSEALAGDLTLLAQVAVGGEADAGEIVRLLARVEDLVVALNAELAGIEERLAPIPEIGIHP